MKKNIVFLAIMIIVSSLLFLLKSTGIAVHIILSVIGLVTLAISAIMLKKEWKSPISEVLMRVFYAIALVTGVVIMNVQNMVAAVVIHKVSAVLFTMFLLVVELRKIFPAKE